MNIASCSESAKRLLATAAITGFAAAALSFGVGQAYAETVESPLQVSDDITRVHVNKIDPDSKDYVEGATLAIYEYDADARGGLGTKMVEWVSEKRTFEYDKHLNVGVEYVLHEVAAPDTYAKANDVRFVIDPIEGNGIHILNDGGEGNVELESDGYSLNLYDKYIAQDVEVTVTKQREGEHKDEGSSDGSWLVKTGDKLAVGGIVGIVVAAVLAAVALIVSRKKKDSK